jgi:AcrR family transcriptional regulator
LARASQSTLEPRKAPVQARSAASVEAILKATLQVLRKVGKERLTTTLVAARAGVSVGTLYQYFPNKSALLRAALQRHMDEIVSSMEEVCREQAGCSLQEMAAALVTRFLAAKMKDAGASVALYAVSADVDGARIARESGHKINRAVVKLLGTAKDGLHCNPHLMGSMLQATMVGVSRRMLESASPEGEYEALRDELVFLVRAYVGACARASTAFKRSAAGAFAG